MVLVSRSSGRRARQLRSRSLTRFHRAGHTRRHSESQAADFIPLFIIVRAISDVEKRLGKALCHLLPAPFDSPSVPRDKPPRYLYPGKHGHPAPRCGLAATPGQSNQPRQKMIARNESRCYTVSDPHLHLWNALLHGFRTCSVSSLSPQWRRSPPLSPSSLPTTGALTSRPKKVRTRTSFQSHSFYLGSNNDLVAQVRIRTRKTRACCGKVNMTTSAKSLMDLLSKLLTTRSGTPGPPRGLARGDCYGGAVWSEQPV